MKLRDILWAAMLASCLSERAWGQWSRDPVTNYVMRQATGMKSIGDYVGEGIAAAGQLSAIKAKLAAELSVARRTFWKEYPNGPGFEQAAVRFAGLLKTKDDYYSLVYTLRANPTMGFINTVTGGDVDGGIPDGARKAFTIWADQLHKNLGGGQLNAKTFELLMDPQKAKAEREKAQPLYLDYRLRRDWEEFRAAGIKPPNVEQAFWDGVLFGFKLRANAGITDSERSIDPYTYAFEAWQRGDSAAKGCAAYIPQLTKKDPVSACQCIQKVFSENLAPRELDYINAEFTEERFLLTAVSLVGLHEKVGACLR